MNYYLSLQGERIFRLFEMCRKLETEEEKVTPFYSTSLTPREEEFIHEATYEEPPLNKLTEVRKLIYYLKASGQFDAIR